MYSTVESLWENFIKIKSVCFRTNLSIMYDHFCYFYLMLRFDVLRVQTMVLAIDPSRQHTSYDKFVIFFSGIGMLLYTVIEKYISVRGAGSKYIPLLFPHNPIL